MQPFRGRCRSHRHSIRKKKLEIFPRTPLGNFAAARGWGGAANSVQAVVSSGVGEDLLKHTTAGGPEHVSPVCTVELKIAQ